MEEGYVQGKCKLLGYIIVDHNDNPKWNKESPYPKVGYQVFYRMISNNYIHSKQGMNHTKNPYRPNEVEIII